MTSTLIGQFLNAVYFGFNGLRELFADGKSRRQEEHEATIHDLHAKIGELTVERDLLHASSGAEPGRAKRDDRTGARRSEREPAVPTGRAESPPAAPRS